IDGQAWMIGDVRLDGRDTLFNNLNHGKSQPELLTDEELVLRAWCDRQQDLGELLLGEFAFGVWEAGRRQFSGLRDLIGAKPFFYARAGDTFCFSNTLDALRVVPGVDLRLDETFVADFLLCGWCADLERTAYRGIQRLKPGHLLEFRKGEATQRCF